MTATDYPETISPSSEVSPVSDAADEAISVSETNPDIVVPDPPRDEADRIDPVPTGPVTLSNGMLVEINPLKLRETMKLLKIVTRGAGGVLEALIGDLDVNDSAAFAQTFGALIIMSIPEAENEAVEFIQSMVVPVDLDKLPRDEAIDKLNAVINELSNPDLEDVVTIIERVVRRESEDIRNLGKRITTAFQMTRRVTPSQTAAK